jgi:hypothetical protein
MTPYSGQKLSQTDNSHDQQATILQWNCHGPGRCFSGILLAYLILTTRAAGVEQAACGTVPVSSQVQHGAQAS